MRKQLESLSPINSGLSFDRLPRVASQTTVLIGCLVLVGWGFDVLWLKSLSPSLATMKANTAVCFILTGASLWFLGTKPRDRRARRISQGFALATTLIALLTSSEYLFDRSLGIDQLLFKDVPATAGDGQPGRMSPATAANFLLTGLALLLFGSGRRLGLAVCLVLITALSSLLALLGYAYGVHSLYKIAAYSSMALHTALTFLVLCLGCLFIQPYSRLASLIAGDQPGGMIARRLLPACIVVPALMGWLKLIGYWKDWYEFEFGVALFSMFSMLLFCALVWSNARLLNQADSVRKQADIALRKAVEELDARVEQRTAELMKANAALEVQIAERRRSEERLQQSNRDLEDFAYVASHDLQEPLRMVTSFVQLLAKRYQGALDQQADEYIGYAVGGAKQMRTLINDLLAYSRVGRTGGPIALVDCTEVLNQTLLNLHTAIAGNGAVITHDPLPTLNADQTQMGQLFQNLISNAIKFRSEAPPKIHISARLEENAYNFAVSDNGIGIDMAYAQRIFTIFQRLHTKEAYPGTGVGLAICKKIVERHGGWIRVESAPGVGTTFYFTIPA